MRNSRTNLKTATLEELENECMELMGTPYGHNMIGIICRTVEDRFGEEEANRLFETYQI
tara:strand:+ start:2831 stop:3007 length:177 start_codon:yes stop_codon:yes gene_type:complete